MMPHAPRTALFATLTASVLAMTLMRLDAQESNATTWTGVYSAAQAAKGEALYNQKCSNCHGSGAGGGDSPSLTDSGFAANWDGLSVQQLFERIRVSMPEDAPGTLTREETAAIVAYLFKQNRFPAGTTDLSDRAEMLGMVKYVAAKP